MKTAFVLSIVVSATLLSAPAQAKEASQTATIVTMNSVPCGGHLTKTRELPCREYVLRSGSTEYHIQQKVERKPTFWPSASKSASPSTMIECAFTQPIQAGNQRTSSSRWS